MIKNGRPANITGRTEHGFDLNNSIVVILEERVQDFSLCPVTQACLRYLPAISTALLSLVSSLSSTSGTPGIVDTPDFTNRSDDYPIIPHNQSYKSNAPTNNRHAGIRRGELIDQAARAARPRSDPAEPLRTDGAAAAPQ